MDNSQDKKKNENRTPPLRKEPQLEEVNSRLGLVFVLALLLGLPLLGMLAKLLGY